MMYYLIYKITNRLNNKFYVGKHKTEDKDDAYFGSGILLDRAVKKHGKENFVKELLVECATEEEMNQRETDIVDEDFIARDDTYNVMLGGNGGWYYVNENGLTNANKPRELFVRGGVASMVSFWQKYRNDPEFGQAVQEKRKNSTSLREYYSSGNSFAGKTHTRETRNKMRDAKVGKYDGSNNPVFGKHWVTDGVTSKMVEKSLIPTGWRKGRV